MGDNSKRLKPAVILSTHTIGTGLMRALGPHGIDIIAVYYDKRDMGYVSKYALQRLLAPNPEKFPEQFIDVLVRCAEKHAGGILIPADDATLVIASKFKDLLSAHYTVACPEWPVVQCFIDKKYTYQLAQEIGIQIPKTLFAATLTEAEKYAESVRYPCLVKPCQSHLYFEHFRRKMSKVYSAEQLLAEYKSAMSAGFDVLLQEYIPGPDCDGINYNCYFWDGRPLVEFTAEKVRLYPPDSGVPAVVISKHCPEVFEPGRRILRALGFYGYCCCEFKKDIRDGTYKLMEINGRHNRSLMLAVKCGLNFPLMEYEHLLYGKKPLQKDYKEGVYWIDLSRDIATAVMYLRRHEISLRAFFRPYFNKHVFAIFSIRDLIPFAKRCVDILKLIIRKLFTKVVRRRKMISETDKQASKQTA